MADGDEIGAAADRIAKHGFVETGLGVGVGIAMRRRLVDGIGDFVPDRLNGAEVGDDGVKIVRQQCLVEIRSITAASGTPARRP
jgi:hypothetical protein